MPDADPLIRRLERDALVFCGLATAAALAIRPGDPRVAAGVAGGGFLALVSLMAIRSTVDALLSRIQAVDGPAAPPDPEGDVDAPAPAAPSRAGAGLGPGLVLKLAGRYLVLGLAAYVMIARLRLHPVGVLAGVSSVAAAAFIEAVRFLTKNRLF